MPPYSSGAIKLGATSTHRPFTNVSVQRVPTTVVLDPRY